MKNERGYQRQQKKGLIKLDAINQYKRPYAMQATRPYIPLLCRSMQCKSSPRIVMRPMKIAGGKALFNGAALGSSELCESSESSLVSMYLPIRAEE